MRKKISSDKMPWKKILFDVSNCDGELLISLFSSMENVAIIEIGNQVEVIFPAGDWQKIFDILKLYHAEFDIPQLIVSESDVSEENWALKWQKYFKKIDLPNGICICPFWEEPTPDAELEIAIKPGMAFGTGTHETTQMALLLLKKYIRPGMKVLDAGCGDGILTIAALKLGALSVEAWDIDPDVEDNFYDQMNLNGIQENYMLKLGDVTELKSFNFDLILSNIERNPNLKLPQSIAENGSQSQVIFTSILTIESEFFARDVLNYGRAIKETMTKGEWIAMVVK